MKSQKIPCVVILAGGKGERLWPLSRLKKPKQFLSLDGFHSLLEQTVQRAERLTIKKNIFVLTTKDQKQLVQTSVGDRIHEIMVEPEGKNTGPAILYACLMLKEKLGDIPVIFLPSDHFIGKSDLLYEDLMQCVNSICYNDVLLLLGIKPSFAATGYGYIEYQESCLPYRVIKFHEKPSQKIAQEYIRQPNMLWNSGIFCGRIEVFLREFSACAPMLTQQMEEYLMHMCEYNILSSISFDHAVLEKTLQCFVYPCHFEWSDIGNLSTFLSLQTKNTDQKQPIITINAQNNFVQAKDRLVALIGVENLCIIEMDDVLMIIQQNQAEEVKKVLTHIKQHYDAKYL